MRLKIDKITFPKMMFGKNFVMHPKYSIPGIAFLNFPENVSF